MRGWGRTPGLGFDSELPRRAHAPVRNSREQVSAVRRWLANYQELKRALEAICELNHDLLRPDGAVRKPGRKRGD